MKWRIYAYQRPSDGVEYVVGRPNAHSRPSLGLYKYCESYDGAYWVSRNGSSIKCLLSDNWCSVEDIIDRVEEMIVEDIEEELEKSKYRI